ncbi:MAG TPA: carbohydrate ABC transporter permease [Caproiciproducens sp.]|nr:carbohydrate ABC transporter permease [Caproiciproducens sp.]
MKKSKNSSGVSKYNRLTPKFNILLSALIIFAALLCIIPVVFVIMISLSSEKSIELYGYQFWPKQFSLYAYQFILQSNDSVIHALLISVFITIAGTAVGVVLNSTMGYVLSRKTYAFKKAFTWIVLIPMLFNGGMISYYMIVSTFLNLKDNLLALIIPMAVSSYYIIILRTFFKTNIPEAIIESAKIDGASELVIYSRIVMPISLPGIATIGLFLTFAYWNDWYNALLFIDSSKLAPLQLLLIRMEDDIQYIAKNSALLGAGGSSVIANLPVETVRMAIVVLVVLPIACSYPFFQKYFISGLTIGSVKE